MIIPSFEKTGHLLRANLLFISLSAFVLTWTWYCVSEMWAGFEKLPETPEITSYHGDRSLDLPEDLTYLVFELTIFLLILRPGSYNLKRSVSRCILLLLLMLPLGIVHCINLMHAGSINGIMFLWWLGMFAVTLALFITNLCLRRFY